MLFARVEQRLQKLADEPVTVSNYESRGEADTYDADTLVQGSKLTTADCTEHEVFFRGDETDTVYCKARYFRFTDASVALIDWVEVHKSVRGNGVGRLVRRAILDDLETVDSVYSKIINDRLISVALDQGFRQIKHGDLEGWFVRE